MTFRTPHDATYGDVPHPLMGRRVRTTNLRDIDRNPVTCEGTVVDVFAALGGSTVRVLVDHVSSSTAQGYLGATIRLLDYEVLVIDP